ncbi:MAG: 3-phosphoserine/phosphohydroxythreonine transaminase [Myxococcota bacterium]
MSRIHNFSAGPAVLPESVLQQAQQALWDFEGSGLGLLEISHRSKLFDAVVVSARERLARLLGVSDTHEILFLQGGASSQFYMVPMNLLQGGRATYLNTGRWSGNAIKEAERFGTVDVPYTAKDDVPADQAWGDLPSGTKYLHYTSNNTVAGSQFSYVPTADVPLIVDASSDILSRPSDAHRHALIYAGAQKNLGPSGLTVVAVRRDLVEHMNPNLPTMLSYRTHVDKQSMFNTPPTFPIFVVERVCAWIEDNGGLAAMGEANRAQASKVYGVIDGSDFWHGKVHPSSRSIMNPTFTTGDPEQDTRFWQSAAAEGLNGLKGHKSVGGLRASLYNALPDAAVDALVAFMHEFERTKG